MNVHQVMHFVIFYFHFSRYFRFSLDPVVGNEVVAAGIGCDMPSLENPYSASPNLQRGIVSTTVSIIALVFYLYS